MHASKHVFFRILLLLNDAVEGNPGPVSNYKKYFSICHSNLNRPSPNTKRGGVCIFYRRSLLLRAINIGYLHKFLSFELQIGDTVCNFLALYRSPFNLKTTLKPLLIIL